MSSAPDPSFGSLKLALRARCGLAETLVCVPTAGGYSVGQRALSRIFTDVLGAAVVDRDGLWDVLSRYNPRVRRNLIAAVLPPSAALDDERQLQAFERLGQRTGRAVCFCAGLRHQANLAPDRARQGTRTLSRCIYAGVRGELSRAAFALHSFEPEVLGDLCFTFAKPLEYWRPEADLVAVGLPSIEFPLSPLVVAELLRGVRELLEAGKQIRLFASARADLSLLEQLSLPTLSAPPIVAEDGEDAYLDAVRRATVFIGFGAEGAALAAGAQVPLLLAGESDVACRDLASCLDITSEVLELSELRSVGLLAALEGRSTRALEQSRQLGILTLMYREKQINTALRILVTHRQGLGDEAWQQPLSPGA